MKTNLWEKFVLRLLAVLCVRLLKKHGRSAKEIKAWLRFYQFEV